MGGETARWRSAPMRVSEPGAEDVDASCISLLRSTLHKAHLEQNLRIGGGHFDIEQVDDFAGGGGNLDGARRSCSDP